MNMPSLGDQGKVVAVIGGVALGSAALAYFWSRGQDAGRKLHRKQHRKQQQKEQEALDVQMQPLDSHQHRLHTRYRRVCSHGGEYASASRASGLPAQPISTVRRATVDGSHAEPTRATKPGVEQSGGSGSAGRPSAGRDAANGGSPTAQQNSPCSSPNSFHPGSGPTSGSGRPTGNPRSSGSPLEARSNSLPLALGHSLQTQQRPRHPHQHPEAIAEDDAARTAAAQRPSAATPAANGHTASPSQRHAGPAATSPKSAPSHDHSPQGAAVNGALTSPHSADLHMNGSTAQHKPQNGWPAQPPGKSAANAMPESHRAQNGWSAQPQGKRAANAMAEAHRAQNCWSAQPQGKSAAHETMDMHARAGPGGSDPAYTHQQNDQQPPGAAIQYDWTQTPDEVVVILQAPPTVKSHDVHCRITAHKLHLNIKDQIVLDGPLFEAVRPDDCNWEFDGYGQGRRLTVTLVKAHNQHEQQLWTSVLKVG